MKWQHRHSFKSRMSGFLAFCARQKKHLNKAIKKGENSHSEERMSHSQASVKQNQSIESGEFQEMEDRISRTQLCLKLEQDWRNLSPRKRNKYVNSV